MRRGITRIKLKKRKKQLRKLGIKQLRCRRMLGGVGIGDHHLMEEGVGVGLEDLRRRVKGRVMGRCCLLSSSTSSGINNISNNNNNNDPLNSNNLNMLKALLCNINPHPNNIKHHPLDPLNSSNNRVISKYQVDTPSSNNSKIAYLNKVINHLRSIRIKCSTSSSNKLLLNNRGGQTMELNHLHCHSRRKLSLRLINLGIDPPRLHLRQNNQRITSSGLCTFNVLRLESQVMARC